MTSLIPLERPVWSGQTNKAVRPSYWTIYRCSTTCSGHIIPFSIFKKINISEVPIDIKQWMIVIKQELLAYENLVNPSNANVVEEGMATGTLVQEIDQPQPEEVSNYNKSSPRKENKTYMGRNKTRPHVKIFGA